MPSSHNGAPIRPYQHKQQPKKKKRHVGLFITLGVFAVLVIAGAIFIENNMEFTPEGVRFTFGGSSAEGEGPIESLTALPAPITDETLPAFAPKELARYDIGSNGLPPTGTPSMEGRYIDLSQYSDTAIAALVAGLYADGVDCVTVDVKKADGTLCYSSASKLALSKRGINSSGGLLETFIELCGNYSIKVTGIIHCLRDNTIPRSSSDCALLTSSGAVYIDGDYSTWLDPSNGDVRQYLLDIVTDAENMGLREVILDDFCYPYTGKLDSLDYQDADRAGILSGLLQSMGEVAASMRLGVVIYDDTVGEGFSEPKGQELTRLSSLCDRLWMHVDSLNDAIKYRGQLASLSEDTASMLCITLDGEYLSDEIYIERYKAAAYAAAQENG